MKKIYIAPEIEVTGFDAADIILASGAVIPVAEKLNTAGTELNSVAMIDLMD